MRYVRWALALSLALPVAAADLPAFSLKDPAGAVHTHHRLLKRGAVVIVTIPNIKHGEIQSHYARHLARQLPPNGPQLVIIEDLSQSMVRGMAVRSMRAKYHPGESTLLLLDEDGAVRRDLQVPSDETAVLVYDPEGRLVRRDGGWSSADEIADAARQIARAAQALVDRPQREGAPAVAEK